MIDATIYLQAVMQRHRLIRAYLRSPVDIGVPQPWRRDYGYRQPTSVYAFRRARRGQDPAASDLRYHGKNTDEG